MISGKEKKKKKNRLRIMRCGQNWFSDIHEQWEKGKRKKGKKGVCLGREKTLAQDAFKEPPLGKHAREGNFCSSEKEEGLLQGEKEGHPKRASIEAFVIP